ncbi:MAG: polyprenyl synthetase family protein, partial [Firmicutes bacterium]|nr:polyprenyl synthetase family protein [Bacillota bacterium]
VAGQTADILAEQQTATAEHLEYIEANKTGQLIRAALVAGAQAMGATDAQIEAMAHAGRAFGKAFQIQDDILDVEGDAAELGKATGHDAEYEKVTFVTLYGIEEAKRQVAQLSLEAKDALNIFDNQAGRLLQEWIEALIYRKK